MSLKKNIGPFQSNIDNDEDDFDQNNFDIFTPFDLDDRTPSAKVVGTLKGMGSIAIGITLLIFLYAMLPGTFKFIFKLAEEFFNWVDKIF